jgi:HEAT repeat protein
MRHGSSALAVCFCLILAGAASAQPPAAQPTSADLIRALQGRDFNEAFRAAERLGDYAAQRAQVIPALIDALRNREWASCGGDVRDAAARSLAQLKAKEAVVPLLELVKSGKPLEHECVE